MYKSLIFNHINLFLNLSVALIIYFDFIFFQNTRVFKLDEDFENIDDRHRDFESLSWSDSD